MVTPEQHISKYKHNSKLLKEACFNIEDSRYLDWVITIIFYSALHLIQSELVKYGVTCKNHEETNDSINKVSKLKPISAIYYSLYMESRKSRYGCVKYRPEKVKKIILSFEKIEKQVLDKAS